MKMTCYENVLNCVYEFKQDKTKTFEYIKCDRGDY